MANVPFTLKTFGLKLTRSMRANVVFTPSNSAALGPGGIHIGRVVVPFSDINADTGVGIADLAPTSFLRPSTHYIVSIEWLEKAPDGWAEIKWPLRVPPTGGNLSDLLDLPQETGVIAIGMNVPQAIPGVLIADIAGNALGLAELVYEEGAYL